MEEIKPPATALLNALLGKKVVVKTNGGIGIKDIILVEGNYTGILVDFDHNFIKLEYNVRRFPNGIATDTKDVVLVNIAYVITVEEFRHTDEQAE